MNTIGLLHIGMRARRLAAPLTLDRTCGAGPTRDDRRQARGWPTGTATARAVSGFAACACGTETPWSNIRFGLLVHHV